MIGLISTMHWEGQITYLDLSYGWIRREVASGVLICAMLFTFTGVP
jgi:hypothetical protein